jgi:hypothetical protein
LALDAGGQGALPVPQSLQKIVRECLDGLAQQSAAPEEPSPVDMVLYCPSCGVQHIDTPGPTWKNPPHRSHLCLGCGHIWRPADVPTNGVATIKTKGKADSPTAEPARADRQGVALSSERIEEIAKTYFHRDDTEIGDVKTAIRTALHEAGAILSRASSSQGMALSDAEWMEIFEAAHKHSFFVFQREAKSILSRASSSRAEVERDAARLDWLQTFNYGFYNLDRISATRSNGFNGRKTLREAIDAAMLAAEAPNKGKKDA